MATDQLENYVTDAVTKPRPSFAHDFFLGMATAAGLCLLALLVLWGATRYAVANDDKPVDVQIATACYVERGSEMVCE